VTAAPGAVPAPRSPLAFFDQDFPVVDGVTAAVYEVPTDQPEADGTLAWAKTTLVVANVTAGGAKGLGYTYAASACKPLIEGELAAAITGRCVLDTGAAWESMVRAVRNLSRPGLVSYAISAVDTALWDLKATLLDLPLSGLLGRVRDTVPVYGSGGFTTYDEPAARTQLERWVNGLDIPRVKIKIGESWGTEEARDLARIAFARRVIGPGAELYVDANGGYTRKQAVRMGRAMASHGVTWFEEPVSSDDLDGLREVRDRVDSDVTAGEYGTDLPYFARMVDARAVDCLQADVTRCGGITEWLRAAAVAAARGLQVSGHCAPNLHAHVAAAVPNLRHLEYFHDHARIENMFFDGALSPEGGALRPDPSRPGHGLALKEPNAAPYRVA
jgi:L-alanine-DL-glutamate epimerase-like enolase superfamily enzyme